jgi:hypothetical protein
MASIVIKKELCTSCGKAVYPNDKFVADEIIFHKSCFRFANVVSGYHSSDADAPTATMCWVTVLLQWEEYSIANPISSSYLQAKETIPKDLEN